jgi:hypothetical protein
MTRYATLTPRADRPASDALKTVRRYLPSNYSADLWQRPNGAVILIHGEDSAGWTLDGYVLPRLASGMLYARERQGTDSVFD